MEQNLSNNIMCPYCHKGFPLTEAITHQLEDTVRNEIEQKLMAQYTAQYGGEVKKAKEEARAWAQKTFALELQDKNDELQRANQQNDSYRKREQTLLQKERELEEQKRAVQLETEKRVSDEVKKAYAKAQEQVKAQFALELQDKSDELARASQQVSAYREKERALLQKERELEEQKHAVQLGAEKRVNDEVKKAYAKAQEQTEAAYALKLQENDFKLKEQDKTIEDLKQRMQDAQKRAQQGSTQLQGEILELDTEALLAQAFPEDAIEEVKKGKKGGDIIQTVRLSSGRTAGKILWELKRTKTWSDGWLDKLKEDTRESKAELAVLSSEALPPYIEHFGYHSGVWITDIKYRLGLATALRESLKTAAAIKQANEGKADKAEQVFAYLTGTQFKQRVEAILESYAEMQGDLDAEKRAMEKSWAKREKQIERFVKNISGMYGDLQGSGAALPHIPLLELE
ncbi:DUF2130 domain-containing protein [Treponema endosymbiont of Eucomonympha sp.]|uniref:DUF2130 domain-containing protein n=1 Tax=Treponema endosymbiont of Eucomonympha sp. TaxID=1580831 RepID=UPI000751272E|nr:DUF2130 domain-containing protein [Treponema endosymbiont of Eucomonympha sp.]